MIDRGGTTPLPSLRFQEPELQPPVILVLGAGMLQYLDLRRRSHCIALFEIHERGHVACRHFVRFSLLGGDFEGVVPGAFQMSDTTA